MAYVDQNQSKEKTVSFIITLIIVLGVGYAFVTGLAYNIVQKAAKDLNVIDVQDQPPPPPEPPPPPPEQKVEVPPPPVSPPPIVQAPSAPPPIQTVQTMRPSPPPVIAPPAPPPPRPAPPSQASGVKPKGAYGSWVTPDDYPPGALRNEEAGRTGFKLDVDGTGRATNCTVTSSSGHPDLDDTACKLLIRRSRFTPAKDAAGNGLPSVYSSSVLWQIPKD